MFAYKFHALNVTTIMGQDCVISISKLGEIDALCLSSFKWIILAG